MSTVADPLGHELLATRIASIPAHLEAMLKAPVLTRRAAPLLRRVVATGIGSSEAHARYLVWLLNTYTDSAAEFVPLARFAEPVGPEFADRTLVLFSQGLSQNTRLVLRQRESFGKLVLFTAATETGLRMAGKPERADLLARLFTTGAEVVPFPLEDEYTILIRVVGPACGFLAARQWVASIPGNRLPPLDRRALLRAFRVPGADVFSLVLLANARLFARGFRLLAAPPLCEFAQNLQCKFVEGLFWPAPGLTDLLSFAHGPFQQLAARPAPIVILQGGSPLEQELAPRAELMCHALGLPVLVVPLLAPPDWAVLEAEAFFNAALLPLLRALHVNQCDWPGKSHDYPLYAFP